MGEDSKWTTVTLCTFMVCVTIIAVSGFYFDTKVDDNKNNNITK